MSIVPETHAALLDLCRMVEDGSDFFRNSMRRAMAGLATRLRTEGVDMTLTAGEIDLVLEVAETVAKAVIGGKITVGSEALMRVCERIVFDGELGPAFCRPPSLRRSL